MCVVHVCSLKFTLNSANLGRGVAWFCSFSFLVVSSRTIEEDEIETSWSGYGPRPRSRGRRKAVSLSISIISGLLPFSLLWLELVRPAASYPFQVFFSRHSAFGVPPLPSAEGKDSGSDFGSLPLLKTRDILPKPARAEGEFLSSQNSPVKSPLSFW